LNAGVGTSTVAALTAHRSASGGAAPVLIDLDRRAPTLALRAGRSAATISDAMLRPGGEAALLSRWGEVRLLPGSADLHRLFDAGRIVDLVDRLSGDSPIVMDLGAGAEALDPAVLARVDVLGVVVGPTIAQLQAAFCSIPLLDGAPCRVGTVVVNAVPEDAARIAARLPWPLLASLPPDPFLAADQFAVRAMTARALDPLIRSLG
jgi:MinD-like ATPase involved in chromosome partitioning or flagellar assembly